MEVRLKKLTLVERVGNKGLMSSYSSDRYGKFTAGQSFSSVSRGMPGSMRRLINELSKLPSIGEKSAARLAYYLLTSAPEEAENLARAILDARQKVCSCKQCFAFAESEVCNICADASRDREVICVVEKPVDVLALEKVGRFRGLYHVLHGLWSPLRGVSPDSIRIPDLLRRLEETGQTTSPVKEVILALSGTVEGDATCLYIAQMLSSVPVTVSRIARGLPKGGELEYADDLTIGYAFEGRKGLGS